MISFILFFAVLIIALAKIFIFDRKKIFAEKNFAPLRNTVIFIIIGILVSVFQPYKLERVDAGHIGIKVKLTGDLRGVSKFEIKTGWVVYNTWLEDLHEFPTFQQHIDYEEQVVITKGGFQTTIKPSFNYSLNSGQIGDMFQNLRRPLKEIEQQWLLNCMISSVNDVANVWTIDDIFNNREKFESAILLESKKRISKWFNISQLRTNIVPPEALKNSIIEKTKAIQDVQVAESQKKVADADRYRRVVLAQTDSIEMVIEAQAIAQSMKIKKEEITPLYIEYLKWYDVDKGTPRVPSTVLGSNTSYLIK